MSCPLFGDIENGQVTVTTNGSVTVASFTCDVDYTLSGDNTRTCTTTGTWRGSAPECGMKTCKILILDLCQENFFFTWRPWHVLG